MSLVFLDGFGAYGTGAHSSSTPGDDLLLNFASYTSVTISALAQDNNGTRQYATGILGANLRPDVGGLSTDTVVLGFRFYHTLQDNENLICVFENNVGGRIALLGILGTRLVFQGSAAGGGSVASVSANSLFSNRNIRPNTWNYIEVKITFDNSAGSVAFRINGADDASLSGIDTEASSAPGPMTRITFMPNVTSDWQTGNRLADIYIDDGTTFRGPMEVWYQEADASGSEADWTPLASTNESQVDEIGSDEDTSYNSSTVAGNTDSLGTSRTLDDDPIALQPMVHARVVSPGTSTVRVGTKSDPGGTPTESFGATVGLSDTYEGVVGAIDETDPDTAAAWTAAGADAAEIMYEQVT